MTAKDKTGRVTNTVVQVERIGDRIQIPENVSFDTAIQTIQRMKEYEESYVMVSAEFPGVQVQDGAYALHNVLSEMFGWVNNVPTPGFFGNDPPVDMTIWVSHNESKRVAWGRMTIPGLAGYIQTSTGEKSGHIVFAIHGEIKRKGQALFDTIIEKVKAYLKVNSLYKGRALRVTFTDGTGKALPMVDINFWDTSKVSEKDVIFSREVEDAIGINLFSPIKHRELAKKAGVPFKRGVLLAGSFGTGKSLAAAATANVCETANVTFVYVTKQADLQEAIRFAAEYSPSVVFCEDVDRITDGNRSVSMDQLLNIVDGIESKGSEVMVVFTTNEVENINKAMLRPGRLDAIINVLPPDAEAAERLIRMYGRGFIPEDVALGEAANKLSGQIPAVIREAVERAKLASIYRNGKVDVNEEDLITAANSMKNQLDLLAPKVEDSRSEREKAAVILVDGLKSLAANHNSNLEPVAALTA